MTENIPRNKVDKYRKYKGEWSLVNTFFYAYLNEKLLQSCSSVAVDTLLLEEGLRIKY
jgi:hypothetical protein